MNLKSLQFTVVISTTLLLQLCTSQDYGTPTYNPDVNQPNPTSDYLDPRYENPYDPNRRSSSNRNPYNVNQYDPTQNPNPNQIPYDPNRSQYDPNKSPYDPNRSPYDPNRSPYDPNRSPYDPNKSSYDPNKGQYDPNRGQYDTNRGQYESGLDPTYNTNQYRPTFTYKGTGLDPDNVFIKEATYFIVASRMVRPGQIYKISANILRARLQMTIRASISCNGVEITDVIERVKEGVPEILNMRVPATTVPGDYKLRVEGLYLDDPFGGKAFINETQLTFSKRFMTIFIQTDKPVYMQSQIVRFRVIPISTELKAFGRAVDVYILDPNRRIMKRWLSRQSNFGTVSLQYQMSDQPLFGEWTIRVEALGQEEETQFLVEEYYQTRFEVNVTMPAFFFNTEPYIHGKIMANYTSGAPVRGNLTLKATVRPIPQYRPQYYRQGQFNNRGQFGPQLGYGNNQYTRVRPNYNPYLYNESGYQAPYDQLYPGQTVVDEYGRVVVKESQYRPGQPNQIDQPDWWYDPQKVYTRVFNFDEKFPFWMQKPDATQYYLNNQNGNPNTVNYNNYPTTSNTYGYYNNPYYDQLPYLRFFNGTYDFRYPMSELAQLVPNLDGMEVIITASVGDPLLDDIIEGYSIARIFNSSLQVTFLGGTPQVFKPAMPFDVYMVVSYHDGSPLPRWQAAGVSLVVQVQVEGRGGAVEPQHPTLAPGHDAVWHLKMDLYKLLKLQNEPNSRDILNGITGVRLNAQLVDAVGNRASADMHFIAHYSPSNRHIRISTTTTNARVGEYIIFHVMSNFYMESFNYVVMSKGIILTSSQEIMQEGVRTFAVTVSAEMAPVATIVVWCAERRGHVLADSLTFPVNGISRNNFTVTVNNRKHRTGERVEVAIYGEPGAYVGLSAIDNAFYTMQAGNELTYAKVISKMARFDEATNGTFQYTWRSHFGDADELVYFPSSTFGIDANRTFEYAGLIVLSDVPVTRRYSNCNASLGYGECLEGGCYPFSKRCDGISDCADHTDEANCERDDHFELSHFRKFRFNRVQRQYDNVWLWRDVNIGPHGRYVFTVDVPRAPAHWTLSAFSMSPVAGLGMHPTVQYVGVLPFFIQVEGPDRCRQGEQVGLRVAVFNYQPQAVEAVVVLESSPDYKFVHVEENGIVRSYNPRTSFGEHQFFVYIPAGDATTVYIPVVPARLGDIHVKLHAATLQGKYDYVKKITVEADGVPQYRHQSILLDLSNRAYVLQYMHVNITETPIIPYEVDRYYVFGSNNARVSLVGDVVGPLFPTMPVNATSLLEMPMDSAEQNMFSFAANMYLTLYMRLINQRNPTTERDAFYHMNTLYQRQLSFMKPDGSFSLFRSDWNQSASSVWLTSFCAKIFQDASFNEWENYIYIDPDVISMAVAWVLDHQTPDGAFYEVTWLPDRNANDTIALDKSSAAYAELSAKIHQHDRGWRDTVEVNNTIIFHHNLTLTAQVVITLETVKNLKDIGVGEGLSARVVSAQQRAITWLSTHLKLLEHCEEPYVIAVVAYALTFSKAAESERAYRILKRNQRSEGGLVYWGREPVPQPPYKMENQKPFLLPRLPYKYDSNNIAATAYALLACMDHQDNNEPIVMWLNSQRLKDGGWASTQDTYIALRALIEYTNRKRLRDVSGMVVSVDAVALRGDTKLLHVENDNLALMRSIDIPEAWGTVKVTARGAGYAILQMSVQYNVDIDKFLTPPPARAFSLVTRAHYSGRNQSHIEYQCCASWTMLQESPRSGMAVLDVRIPTGYLIQQQRLDAYVLSRRVRTLQRARYTPTNMYLYFHYLEEEPTCVNFTVERWFPVANMSRYLPVRVYDYYAPERYNETIFDALPTYLLNICEVCGSSQCPYCSIYNAAAAPAVAIPLLVAAVVVMLSAFSYIRSTKCCNEPTDPHYYFGPKYPPTKGEVWPRPYKEVKGITYYTFYPAQFQFKITNHSCSILTRAVNRCEYTMRQLYGMVERIRQRVGRSRPTLDSARGGPDDKNYLGIFKQLRVNLEKPCEEYPSFGMDESYSLNISASSELKSKSIWGIIRGLESFTHLFYLSDDYNEVRLNTTAIEDAPRYAHRGLLIDTSRHYLSVDNIRKTLDAMAANKMNVLHWHIVDDQSFPYQSRMFPELSEQGAYFPTMIYTRDDIQTVINHARDRGIRVVPEFDVPGHTRSWGNAYPHILTQCYRQNKTDVLGPMNPLRNATYKLLEGLFAEVRDLFPEQYLHVGGDEVNMGCWTSNPELSQYMKAHNMSVNQLHALFMRNTIRLLDNSTKVIVWQEVFDEHVPLAPDALVQAWRKLTPGDMVQILKAGFKVLFSAAWYLDYLDYTFSMMYAADPRTMVFKATGNASLAAGVVGGEACLWGEMADDTNALSRTWPRASAVAEVLWSTDSHGPTAWPRWVPARALHRAEEHSCRMQRRGIPAEPPSKPGFCVV